MMKKRYLHVLLCFCMLAGCAAAKEKTEETSSPQASSEPAGSTGMESGGVKDYETYRSAVEAAVLSESFSAGLKRSYDMNYDSGSISTYDMDGVYEQNHELIHLNQHMNADGLQSETEGWYEDGRLYMTYNGVRYYEDMGADQVREVLLVPLGLHVLSEDVTEQIEISTVSQGTCYTVTLRPEKARPVFERIYDIYGLAQYPDYTIEKAVITQTVNGTVPISEKTEFICRLVDQGIEVNVTSRSEAEYISGCTLSLDDRLKQSFKEYVNYTDIDTSAISEADVTSDLPEATATETLKKRLQNRLNYTVQEDGTYFTEFNENESYRFDFANHIFTYSNRTSRYIYNWEGEIGGFGSTCTLDFVSGVKTDGCDESVEQMIRNVRSFMAMELYYCGVSMDDLRVEAKKE